MAVESEALDGGSGPDADGDDRQVCGTQKGRISVPRKRSPDNGSKWPIGSSWAKPPSREGRRRRPSGLFRGRRGSADPAWLAARSQGVQGSGIAGSAGGLGSREAAWVECQLVPRRAGCCCRSRVRPQPRNPPPSTWGLGERRGMSRFAQHLVHVPSMQFFQVDHLASVFFQCDGAMLHQCQ